MPSTGIKQQNADVSLTFIFSILVVSIVLLSLFIKIYRKLQSNKIIRMQNIQTSSLEIRKKLKPEEMKTKSPKTKQLPDRDVPTSPNKLQPKSQEVPKKSSQKSSKTETRILKKKSPLVETNQTKTVEQLTESLTIHDSCEENNDIEWRESGPRKRRSNLSTSTIVPKSRDLTPNCNKPNKQIESESLPKKEEERYDIRVERPIKPVGVLLTVPDLSRISKKSRKKNKQNNDFVVLDADQIDSFPNIQEVPFGSTREFEMIDLSTEISLTDSSSVVTTNDSLDEPSHAELTSKLVRSAMQEMSGSSTNTSGRSDLEDESGRWMQSKTRKDQRVKLRKV